MGRGHAESLTSRCLLAKQCAMETAMTNAEGTEETKNRSQEDSLLSHEKIKFDLLGHRRLLFDDEGVTYATNELYPVPPTESANRYAEPSPHYEPVVVMRTLNGGSIPYRTDCEAAVASSARLRLYPTVTKRRNMGGVSCFYCVVLTGIVGGLAVSAMLCLPLYFALPARYCTSWPSVPPWLGMLGYGAAALAGLATGYVAARWSRTDQRLWAGVLAGLLAGCVSFCLIGGAAAGVVGNSEVYTQSPGSLGIDELSLFVANTVFKVCWTTHATFWGMLVVGTVLAIAGAWLCSRPESEGKSHTLELLGSGAGGLVAVTMLVLVSWSFVVTLFVVDSIGREATRTWEKLAPEVAFPGLLGGSIVYWPTVTQLIILAVALWWCWQVIAGRWQHPLPGYRRLANVLAFLSVFAVTLAARLHRSRDVLSQIRRSPVPAGDRHSHCADHRYCPERPADAAPGSAERVHRRCSPISHLFVGALLLGVFLTCQHAWLRSFLRHLAEIRGRSFHGGAGERTGSAIIWSANAYRPRLDPGLVPGTVRVQRQHRGTNHGLQSRAQLLDALLRADHRWPWRERRRPSGRVSACRDAGGGSSDTGRIPAYLTSRQLTGKSTSS